MVFVGSDFNSRIGTQNDFITESEKDLNYLPQDYELDTIRSVRNNQDTSVNEYRQQLLDLCIETKLMILNGRTREELQGHLTYVGFQKYRSEHKFFQKRATDCYIQNQF